MEQLIDIGIIGGGPAGMNAAPGIYSAGAAALELYQMITAASMGELAAMSINGELLTEA